MARSRRRRKSKSAATPAPGVPEWVVTYGDMMTLLLCFFILIAAFSEIKKEPKYQRVLDAIKEAFGYVGGHGQVPVDDPPTRSMIRILDEIEMRVAVEPDPSESPDPGVDGRHAAVKRIREGLVFSLGGRSSFDRGSAVLRPEARRELDSVARVLAGRTNRIAIRGHAEAKVLDPGSRWEDLYDLSYARAKSVMTYLVDEHELRAARFHLEACGANEPIAPRARDAEEELANRRVEIIMTEALVDDFHPDADYTDPANAVGP